MILENVFNILALELRAAVKELLCTELLHVTCYNIANMTRQVFAFQHSH